MNIDTRKRVVAKLMQSQKTLEHLDEGYPGCAYMIGSSIWDTIEITDLLIGMGFTPDEILKDLSAQAYACIMQGREEVIDADVSQCIRIQNRAFAGCLNLRSVDASSAEVVDWYAFKDCPNLKTIKLGKNLKEFDVGSLIGSVEAEVVYNGTYDDLNKADFVHVNQEKIRKLNIIFHCTDRDVILSWSDYTGGTFMTYPEGKLLE